MTHRYTGAIGKRFEGNLPRAHEVQGTARFLVQQCIDHINHNGGWGQMSRQLALRDGTIVKAIVLKHQRGWEPIVRVEVFAPQHADHRRPTISWSLYVVWEPEGLFITPRDTEAASQGWGMPRLDHDYNPINTPKGTPYNTTHYNEWFAEGAIKQVILNRFRNNKYPDYWIDRALEDTEDPGHPRDLVATTWPFFAEPSDPLAWFKTHVAANGDTTYTVYATAFEQFPPDGGISLSDRLGEPLPFQAFIFDNDLLVPLFAEIEEADWFCHWPEERPYQGPNAELRLKQFELVNDLRESRGLERLTLPIRGYDCSISDITLQQVQKSNTLAHNSLYFDEGYQGAYHRFVKDGTPVSAGENLAGGVQPEEGLSISEVMYNGWVDSPVHYANMVNPYWTVTDPIEDPPIITGRSGELQFSLGGTFIKRVTESYTGWTAEDLDEPVFGAGGCQTFISREQWVESGTLFWENEDASQRCSWFTWRPFRYALLSRDDAMCFCFNRFFYKGRRQHVDTKYLVLGVALCVEDMTFRIGAYNVVTDSLDILKLPRELPFHPESSDLVIDTIGSYELDDANLSFSYMHFSQDGAKCVFVLVSCADEPPITKYKHSPIMAPYNFISTLSTYSQSATSIENAVEIETTWAKFQTIEFDGTFRIVNTSHTTNVREEDGTGEYEWVFDDDVYVYADYVNNEIKQAKTQIKYRANSYFLKQLVYSNSEGEDGTLIVQQSGAHILAEPSEMIYSAEPLLVELYHFDLRHPEDICYSELCYPAGPTTYQGYTDASAVRRLYVRGEMVSETPAIPRTRGSVSTNMSYDFTIGQFKAFCAPVMYPARNPTITPPTKPFLALNMHSGMYPNEYWAGTTTWDYGSSDNVELAFNHITWDGAGFTARDTAYSIRALQNTAKGPVNNQFASAVPWAQCVSVEMGAIAGTSLIHNTFAVFARYKGEWVFTLRIDGFLGLIPTDIDRNIFTIPAKPAREHPDYTVYYYRGCAKISPPSNAIEVYWCDPSSAGISGIKFPGYTVPATPEMDGTRWNTGTLDPDSYPVGEIYTSTYKDAVEGFDYAYYGYAPISQYNIQEDDRRWATYSSLNLQALVSTDNLSQNIWPMGVL